VRGNAAFIRKENYCCVKKNRLGGSNRNSQVCKNGILQILQCHFSLTAFNLLNHSYYGIVNGSGNPMLSTLGADIAVEIIDFRFAPPFKGLKANER